MAGLKVITPPAIEPVTVADVKTLLKYDQDDETPDEILGPLVTPAREWCEGYQNRAYITQTLELALDCWPGGNVIELPRPQLQSLTSITYTDDEGNSTIWTSSNYIVDDYSFVARVVKKRGVSWPAVSLAEVNGVKVQYKAGYGDRPEDVSDKIKQAITLLIIHWFENGRCDPPPAVYSLLNLDRVVPI